MLRTMALLLSLVACKASGTFHCERDEQCGAANAARCEGTGFCSFADSSCLSGQRYDEFAGGGHAGRCVGESGEIDAGMPDAPPDAPPTWMVVETIMVDTSSTTPYVSQTVLALGVTYRLRASGTASVIIPPHGGDAEYYDFTAPKDNGCCEDVGIGIDDPMIDEMTTPDWGPYNPNHVYEIPFVGKGATISALYQDTVLGNNVGVLTLEILELR